jgi:hypothetical protein
MRPVSGYAIHSMHFFQVRREQRHVQRLSGESNKPAVIMQTINKSVKVYDDSWSAEKPCCMCMPRTNSD